MLGRDACLAMMLPAAVAVRDCVSSAVRTGRTKSSAERSTSAMPPFGPLAITPGRRRDAHPAPHGFRSLRAERRLSTSGVDGDLDRAIVAAVGVLDVDPGATLIFRVEVEAGELRTQ